MRDRCGRPWVRRTHDFASGSVVAVGAVRAHMDDSGGEPGKGVEQMFFGVVGDVMTRRDGEVVLIDRRGVRVGRLREEAARFLASQGRPPP